MQDEQNFRRYATYSMWHRWRSVLRFIGNPDTARALGMIDLDNAIWIEWRKGAHEPLALIEVARDDDSEKPYYVLARFGELAGLPAYVVRYQLAGRPNEAYPAVEDISRFRVRRVWPNLERGYREYTPGEYALWLVQLRESLAREFLKDQGWKLPL